MNSNHEHASGGARRLERYRRSQDGYGGLPASQSEVPPPLPERPRSLPRRVPGQKDSHKQCKSDLVGLIGVRSSDSDGRQETDGIASDRNLPRLSFKPIHAVAVILVLIAILCASLTMLVQQAVNYAKQSPAQSAAVLGATGQSSSQMGGKSAVKGADKPKYTSKESGGSVGQPDGGSGSDDSASQSSAGTGNPGPPSVPDSGLVNINTADVTQLQSIKGVGPVMAQRIVDYRTANGDFASVDGLLAVSGIGPKTLEKMRLQVTV